MFVLCCTSGYILELALLLLFMYPLSFDINYYIQKKKKKKLPQRCRETVLVMAHSVPMSGHLGKNKTANDLGGVSTGQLYSKTWPSTAERVRSAKSVRRDGVRRHPWCHSQLWRSPFSVSPWTLWDPSLGVGWATSTFWWYAIMLPVIPRRSH